MDSTQAGVVVTQDGARGTIESRLNQGGVPGSERVLIRLENGRQMLIPAAMLQELADGSYQLPLALSDLDVDAQASSASGETRIVIPVIVEQARVQKRQVSTGGVRITKHVHTEERQVDASGFREEVDVERVPLHQELDEPAQVRVEGDTIIIPVMEEILVVEKRLVLKEEMRVTRRRETVRQPQKITLRREEVDVEHFDGEASTSSNPTSDGDIQT